MKLLSIILVATGVIVVAGFYALWIWHECKHHGQLTGKEDEK